MKQVLPSVHRRALASVVTVTLLSAAVPSRAWACGACSPPAPPPPPSIGDPSAQGALARHAVSLEMRATTLRTSVLTERTPASVQDVRFFVDGTVSPLPWLAILGRFSFAHRALRDGPDAGVSAFALGDSDLAVRVRPAFTHGTWRFAVSATLGLKLPTAWTAPPADIVANPSLRAGNGSWDPWGGVGFLASSGRWAVQASTVLRFPTQAPDLWRSGHGGSADTLVSVRLHDVVSLSLGAGVRWAAHDHDANDDDVPNTGGWVMSVTPGLIVRPTSHWMLRAGVGVPVATGLSGDQSVGPDASFAVGWNG